MIILFTREDSTLTVSGWELISVGYFLCATHNFKVISYTSFNLHRNCVLQVYCCLGFTDEDPKAAVPNLFGTRGQFCESPFFYRRWAGRSGMVWADSSTLHLLWCHWFDKAWSSGRRRQWHPTPVLLPGKSHGWRSWWAVVRGVARVRHDWATSLSLFTFHFHALEKEMATHSGVLAWRISGTGEPRGLPSTGSHGVGHDWSDLAAGVQVVMWEAGSGCGLIPVLGLGWRTPALGTENLSNLLLLMLFMLFTSSGKTRFAPSQSEPRFPCLKCSGIKHGL